MDGVLDGLDYTTGSNGRFAQMEGGNGLLAGRILVEWYQPLRAFTYVHATCSDFT